MFMTDPSTRWSLPTKAPLMSGGMVMWVGAYASGAYYLWDALCVPAIGRVAFGAASGFRVE